jgi:phosphoglycolate phosphatase
VTSPFHHCPIEAIIFDLDGTLLDSAAQIAAAINVLFRARGLETFDEVEIAQFIGWGSRHLIELAFASRGSILSDKQIAAQEKLYLANYASIAERDIVFFPGAINLIRTMAERELTLGICTNKPERIARAILQKAELLPMFDAIIGGDSGFGLKPSPAPLYAALQCLKATSPKTVFVGDSAIDNEAAFAAEVPFARVRHPGYPTPITPFEPEYKLGELSELATIVDRRNKVAAP